MNELRRIPWGVNEDGTTRYLIESPSVRGLFFSAEEIKLRPVPAWANASDCKPRSQPWLLTLFQLLLLFSALVVLALTILGHFDPPSSH